MAKPKLHLDEDASQVDIYRSLLSKGHDVTRTPNEWINKKASDEEQLQKASGQGRSIFSFNAQDFLRIAKKTPNTKVSLCQSKNRFQ